MKIDLNYIAKSASDWFFKRSLGFGLVKLGVMLLLAAMASGWLFEVSLPWRFGDIGFSLDSAGGTPAAIVYGVFAVGICLVFLGLIFVIGDRREAAKRRDTRLVIGVELRGLRNSEGSPLSDAVPDEIEGRREALLIDIRDKLIDGKVTDPEGALDEIKSLPRELQRRTKGHNRGDVSVVFGGLAPVPNTFLSGLLIDDENSTVVMDWDRHQEKWRLLDAAPEVPNCAIQNLEADRFPEEVALTVSVSYRIDRQDVEAKLPDMPVIEFELTNRSADMHWSLDFQREVSRQFLEVCRALQDKGVQTIHLFLASPSSVAFNLGRKYDTRNLPSVVLYQYQREEQPPYPWGIMMPQVGVREAKIVR